MDIDPQLVIAIGGILAGGYATWRTSRKEEKAARIVANTESIKVTAEFDVKREELLTAGIEAHFHRLEATIKELNARVVALEDERNLALAWLLHNEVPWPPPKDFTSALDKN